MEIFRVQCIQCGIQQKPCFYLHNVRLDFYENVVKSTFKGHFRRKKRTIFDNFLKNKLNFIEANIYDENHISFSTKHITHLAIKKNLFLP